MLCIQHCVLFDQYAIDDISCHDKFIFKPRATRDYICRRIFFRLFPLLMRHNWYILVSFLFKCSEYLRKEKRKTLRKKELLYERRNIDSKIKISSTKVMHFHINFELVSGFLQNFSTVKPDTYNPNLLEGRVR